MNESEHDTREREKTPPEEKPVKGRKGLRLLRRLAWCLAGLVVLLTAALCAGTLFLRTQSGEAWLTTTLNEALGHLPGGLSFRAAAFHGPLPSRAALSGIVLEDAQGVWLEAEEAQLVMDWSALPKAVVVSELSLQKPRLIRLPVMTPGPEEEKEPSEPLSPEQTMHSAGEALKSWPSWLPSFRIDSLAVSRLLLPAALLGTDVQASLSASASLGPSGADMLVHLQRDDVSCPPFEMLASFSREAKLSLNANGSDFGLADLLPDEAGKGAELRFSLAGEGMPERMSVHVNGRLLEQDTGNDMLTAAGEAELLLHEHSASAEITLESGTAAQRLWALAGQKNGHVRATLSAQAAKKDVSSMNVSAAVDLSDMDWTDSRLASLFGNGGALRLSADAEGKDLPRLKLDLKDLSLKAGRVELLAHGEARLSGSTLMDDTDVELHARCALSDAGALSPELAGNALLTADVSGPLTALDAALALSSDSFHLPGITLEKSHAALRVPLADIPRLAEDLPRLFRVRQEPAETDAKTHLLSGQAEASLVINGQKATLDTGWSVEEGETPSGRGLRLALEKLDLRVEDNSVQGNLQAGFPFSPPQPEKGSPAELAGMALPALDGNISVRIRHWTPLARISGLRLSGSPLTLDMHLSSLENQQLEWQGKLDSFQLIAAQPISLSGLKTSLRAKNLWQLPELSLKADLKTLKSSALSLSRVSVAMEGGEKGMRASMQSYGDIQAELALRWKPGEIVVNTLEARVKPSLLTLAGTSPVGMRLSRPAVLRYGRDNLSFPGLSLKLLPSGTAALAGTFSRERMNINAELGNVEFDSWRTLLPDLPGGSADCRLQLGGSLRRPSGNFKLNFNNIRVPGSSPPPVTGHLSGTLAPAGKRRALGLSLVLTDESQKALGLEKAVADLSLPLTSPADGISLPDHRGPLRGTIALTGELGRLWQLLPLDGQRLAGRVDVQADLTGSLNAPGLTLHAALDGGSFADIMQGVELRDIRLRADAENLKLTGKSEGRLNLELSATDGRKGTVEVSGWLEPADMKLSVDGRIHQLSPLRRQDVHIMLSGSAGVSGTVSAPAVRADITVEKGQVQLAKLPGGDIVTLPIEEPGQKKEPAAANIPGTLNARIRIPNQLFIRGYGLDCEWKGDVRLRGALTRPAVTGSVEAVRGTLDILGKRFKLSEGNITFDGGWPVSPVLNIVMQYVASAITADITVSGPASGPEITLSSEPEMPQDEILSQVMFNQSAGSLSHVQALQLAAGAAELAGFGGGGVMDFGRRLLGLDVLRLNSENSTDAEDESTRTSLEMGTYVRDNVYVGVQQGLGRESETEAVVEIELTPGLEAQAKASATKTEVGLEWKKNY